MLKMYLKNEVRTLTAYDGKYYFCGVEVPSDEIKNGWLSYGTMVEMFCKKYVQNDYVIGAIDDFEIVNGEDNTRLEYVYCYYIIDDKSAEGLQRFTDEIIYYSDSLDMYLLGVTHFGTAWSGIDSDIKLELVDE